MDNTQKIRHVLIAVLILNWTVSALKIAYGYASGSIGMVSDGFHSLFDGMSNVIGLVGIRLASQPPDKEHPYGHRKYETLFTIAIAVMIFGAGLQILRQAYESFFDDRHIAVDAGSFTVMVFTILVNIFVSRYELRKGRELGSDFLMADAQHTKSDILTSIAVVIGLLFTRLGYPHADAIIGVLVTAFIVRIGYRIARQASEALVDTVRIDAESVCSVVERVEGVRGCHDIRSRGTGQHICLDLHVTLDPDITLREAHKIADKIEDRIKEAFPSVEDIVVHTEPEGA